MNKRERVDAALRGEPVDRVPISFWGHSYLKEWSAEGLAEAMLENYRTYDWDYMKVNPRASYHVEDWGAKLERTPIPTKATPSRSARAASRATGGGCVRWSRIAACWASSSMRCARSATGWRARRYFFQTIFSPLSVAKYLAGNGPEPVHGLDSRSSRCAASRARRHHRDLQPPTPRPDWRRARAASSSPRPAGPAPTYSPRSSIAVSGVSSTCECWRRGGESAVQRAAQLRRKHLLRSAGGLSGRGDSWAATLPGNPTLGEGKRADDARR